jgi:hypothetical protein
MSRLDGRSSLARGVVAEPSGLKGGNMDVAPGWLPPSPPADCAMCGLRITDELTIRRFRVSSLDSTIPVAHFCHSEHLQWWFNSL